MWRTNKLVVAERRAEGAPDGVLVLIHGRGGNEQNMLEIGDRLDPDHRLHVLAPRGLLRFSGRAAREWYLVPRAGHPDAASFHHAIGVLGAFHDTLSERTGIEPARTVLGGFSMGAILSYALAFDASRPRPAGLLAFSGFLPPVPSWEPDIPARSGLPAFVSHGREDEVIDVTLARECVERLRAGGLEVDYDERDREHRFDSPAIELAAGWLAERLAPAVTG